MLVVNSLRKVLLYTADERAPLAIGEFHSKAAHAFSQEFFVQLLAARLSASAYFRIVMARTWRE